MGTIISVNIIQVSITIGKSSTGKCRCIRITGLPFFLSCLFIVQAVRLAAQGNDEFILLIKKIDKIIPQQVVTVISFLEIEEIGCFSGIHILKIAALYIGIRKLFTLRRTARKNKSKYHNQHSDFF